MKSVLELINEWDKLTFAENPYGPKIPDKYLNNLNLIKSNTKFPFKASQPLSQLKQNGWAISKVRNDESKTSIAESTDYISFSPIFHKLVDENKLCPSNYVYNVIEALNDYASTNPYVLINDDIVMGYITRSLRAFASYIRELDLSEKINSFMPKFAKNNSFTYEMEDSSWQEDMYNKTDILFKLNNINCRVWSYQADRVDKTARRLLRKVGDGLNILVPLLFADKVDYCGWYLYNTETLEKEVCTKLLNEPMPYAELCKKLKEDTQYNIIKNILVFIV